MKTTKPSAAKDVVCCLVAERLEAKGFVASSTGWVRRRSTVFRDVFSAAINRGVIALNWGFLLDYVPQVTATRIQRAPKNGVLVGDSLDLGRRSSVGGPFEVSWLQSRESLEAEARKLIPEAIDAAEAEWNRTRSIVDIQLLLTRLKTKFHGDHHSFDMFPNLSLSLAFSLAMLGRAEAAQAQVEEYIETYEVAENLRAKLRSLLQRTIEEGSNNTIHATCEDARA